MKPRLLHIPFFPFLLPVFFVLHGFVENFFYVHLVDCLTLTGIYLLAALLVLGFFRILLKNNTKAALMAGFVLSFYFFFGVFHGFLRDHLPFLGKYIVLLPLFFMLSVGLFVWLKKRPPFVSIVPWLNSLLLIYLLVDGFALWRQAGRPLRNAPSVAATPAFHPCGSCSTPDIYFLLFDEYSSSKTLREVYGYDNSSLDSFLIHEGFHILPDSRSNYYMTPFSMASMFNSTYLDLRDPKDLTNNDYLDVMSPDRPAAALDILARQGYTIINHSPFDLPGHSATTEQIFITSGARLITRPTLLSCMINDLGWRWFKTARYPGLSSPEEIVYKGNNQSLARTLEDSRDRTSRPRFIYTHLFLPHLPFLFDSLQRRRTQQALDADTGKADLPAYLGYIPYTNARIRELISTIKKNTAGNAVIIFMSDHGFRYPPFEDSNQHVFFNNQNAVYYPDGDYRLFYDSISAVNEFRVVFNKLFHQEVLLLKDSLIYLRDRKEQADKK